ncbi:MAG: 16S rRNA (cytidine(1402)-2'-O)-methyltransferase [Candidatus Wildermuthbacteria bacterium]|nr:16S rRNA (cytidine(1402)-2'-O)-methyltransferase [Candidatus Wildermuthbacteria bacterium]
MPTLYVIATPIGNLEDITLRALRLLKEADAILCEDTRVTSRLLARHGIRTPLIGYHSHSTKERVAEITSLLCQGKTLALVTDAGTPGISDPGNELVSDLCARLPGLTVSPVPGASALVAAASVAGMPMGEFLFLGFPPHKKGRKTFFERVAQSLCPVILYESPFRVAKTLGELGAVAGADRRVVVCRELTKRFETITRGRIGGVGEEVAKKPAKGEFVIVLAGAGT